MLDARSTGALRLHVLLSLDPARAAAAGLPVAGFLWDPLGATVAGVAPLKPAVSLAFWYESLRSLLAPTTFTKNSERLLNDQVIGRFLKKLM